MLRYYQELLNQCIDRQEDQDRLKRMKNTLRVMKNNLKILGGKVKNGQTFTR